MNVRRVTLGHAALITLLAALPAMASDLSPRQLRKNLKQANNSWQAGRVDHAVELYEGILTATENAAPERSGALYALGLVALEPGSGRYDPERARVLLTELTDSFPRHARILEARALLGLLEDKAGMAEKAEKAAQQRLERELAAQKKSFDEEREEMGLEIDRLGTDLGTLREQLAAKDDDQKDSSAAMCADIRKELKDAQDAIRRLAEDCSG